MTTIPYTTKPGDRWDLIAQWAYNNPNAYDIIQDANPNISLTEELDGGITLLIPVVEPIETDTSLLPPWKR